MIPACDHVGTPAGLLGFTHLRSSTASGSASRMAVRMRSRASARQSSSVAFCIAPVLLAGFSVKVLAHILTRLDHFPSVPGWIAEAGVDAAIALDWFLDELDSAPVQLFIGYAAIV